MSPGEAYQQGRALRFIREARSGRLVTGHRYSSDRQRRLRRDAQRALDEANAARLMEREAGLEPTTCGQAVRRSSD